MGKAILGFFVGLFALIVAFLLTTVILSSEHKRTFTEELKSWVEEEKVEKEDTSEMGKVSLRAIADGTEIVC